MGFSLEHSFTSHTCSLGSFSKRYATVNDMKELNKMVTIMNTTYPQRLFGHLQGQLRLLSYPDASKRNNADHSSRCGQVIFLGTAKRKNIVRMVHLLNTNRTR
eukprot:4118233-Amphidinium_carterae.1